MKCVVLIHYCLSSPACASACALPQWLQAICCHSDMRTFISLPEDHVRASTASLAALPSAATLTCGPSFPCLRTMCAQALPLLPPCAPQYVHSLNDCRPFAAALTSASTSRCLRTTRVLSCSRSTWGTPRIA
eukprot:scaffold323028_cov18-Tisochrysis_lutea.AAC.1